MRTLSFPLSSATCLIAAIASAGNGQTPGSKFRILADIPSPQFGCAGAVVSGKLHVFGGATSSGGATDLHQVYDPATDSWSKKAPIPDKAAWPGIAVLQGKVYLFGGDVKGVDILPTDNAFAYDPETDTWKRLSPLPAPREYAAARAVGKYIYIFGSRTKKGDIPDLRNYRYDPAANTYERIADLPEGARFITQDVYGNYIYCVHGETTDRTYADGVLRYDIAKNVWTKLNIPRINKTRWTLSQHSANISIGSKLFILGGMPPEGVRTPVVSYFDMAAETFGVADPMPTGRCCGVSGVIDGTIYTAGGFWQVTGDVQDCRQTWGYSVPKTLLAPAAKKRGR
jgi:N-acetylneuraminic acid mutarotase